MKSFKELRVSKGYTQTKLSKKVGVSVATVRIWEAGGGMPNEENLKRLIDSLGEDVRDCFSQKAEW